MAHQHDEHESHGSLKSYVIGFLLSLVLTAIPLIVVLNDLMEGTPAKVLLLGSAVLQFGVQLIYFMRLKEEKALSTGDHTMGWSTTVVTPPDGDMAQYMASVKKLIARDDEILYPTHGAPVTDPKPFLKA